MTGYTYLKGSRLIIGKVEEVIEATNTQIVGVNSFVRGIDDSKAGVIVMSDSSLMIGDALPIGVVDERNKLPKTVEQRLSLMQAALDEIILGGGF